MVDVFVLKQLVLIVWYNIIANPRFGKVLLLRHCSHEEDVDLPEPVDSKVCFDQLEVCVYSLCMRIIIY